MNSITKVMLKRFARAAHPYLENSGFMPAVGVQSRSAIVWEPGAERVLAISPHMDDETIGCGGTLALHVQKGAQVTVAFLTDGCKGSSELANFSGDELTRLQTELAERRKLEARNALDKLGIHKMICIDAEDGALAECRWAAQRLRLVLTEIKPQLVYLPFYLEEHPDHRATSDILLEAVEGTDLDFLCVAYEVWTPLYPNCLVRIDRSLKTKREALSEYRTQLADNDYAHTGLGLNAYRAIGLPGNGGYAEAFYVSTIAEYRELYKRFRISGIRPRS